MKNYIKRYRPGILLACVIIVSVSITVTECRRSSPPPAYTHCDVSYGPESENKLDLSLPEGRTAATPVIILVHGGAWTGGDKSNFNYLRGYFCERGFAAFSVNYRVAKSEGTGLPDMLDDMDRMLAFVKEKSSRWTYSRDRIFLAGHSAGGHIVLLYSFARMPEGSARGVISYCGLTDLTDHELEIFLKRMDQADPVFAKQKFDRIKFLTGPDLGMRKKFSPLFITRDIPVMLVCGKRDEIVPWSQSDKLHRKMKERGFDSTMHVFPDMGHDMSPYYGTIMKTTEQWMRDRM